jgi:hypothetical protein
MTSSTLARTPLVDVHSHFLTDRYVQAAKDVGIVQPDACSTGPLGTSRGTWI